MGTWWKDRMFSIGFPLESGYTNMKDIVTLIDAICDCYDNKALLPTPQGTTWCNEAVGMICEAMGCHELSGKMADEMVELLKSSADWSLVPLEKAQEMANHGSLLVAALSSSELGQTHGHVCVIRPGKPVYSGKWNTNLCPRVLNIGAENFLACAKHGPLTNQPCGLNEAFVELPKIWAWRPSL
jgi:hypothetical protein